MLQSVDTAQILINQAFAVTPSKKTGDAVTVGDIADTKRSGAGGSPAPAILVIDVGGNNIKVRLDGQEEIRKAKSGPTLTPEKLFEKLGNLAKGWSYDRVTIGVPAPVKNNRMVLEPHNLAKGWENFDFAEVMGLPTRLVNDAAMQALGSYDGGSMLFLGLGTGLGAALVVDGHVLPLELAHLPYKKSRTFEDYLGTRGLNRLGVKRWKKAVFDVSARLKAAMCADYVVLGGGNAKKLSELPPDSRLGDNDNAFVGGVRVWQEDTILS